MLQPIVDSKSFNEAATGKPDLSSLKGVQLAIAVTGFETTEQRVNEENSILNFKPHFVAIADTHTWEYQTRSFAENQLGEFINKVYGGGVHLETTSANGGTEFEWTSEDGRQAIAFVIGSLIFFGNDQSAIERVQAVRRGENDPISKMGKIPGGAENFVVGYISPEGIAQIANIAGAQKAKETGEEAEVQSFVATVLPQLLRGSIKDVTWVANRTNDGIEDTLNLSLTPEVAAVLNETMAPTENADPSLLDFVPADATAATQYNLKNPQIAWRSLLLLAQKLTDETSGKLIIGFSNSFFEPYGIKDGEKFLSSVAPNVVTVKYDAEDDVTVIAKAMNPKERKASLDPEDLKTDGSNVEINEPGFENVVLSGDAQTVQKCVQAHQAGQNLRSDPVLQDRQRSVPSTTTIGNDRDSAMLIAAALSEKKAEQVAPASRYIVETRFNKNGMQRKLISEFGLIGLIIAELAPEE